MEREHSALENNWKNYFVGDVNTETRASRLGECLMVLRDLGLGVAALAKPRNNCKLRTYPLIRNGVPYKKEPQRFYRKIS